MRRSSSISRLKSSILFTAVLVHISIIYLWLGQMHYSDNPLKKYFRQPSIYIRLPSQGAWYEPNSIVMPPNGELAVLPMTANDEITSRTPDALFNGSAVADIVGSCIPSIRNPWSIPSIDINTILVGIRIASYGHVMTIDSGCPKCGHNHEYELDLRVIADNIKCPDYNKKLLVDNLQISFRPLSYKQINDSNILQFEDQKLMQVINQSDIDSQEKIKTISDSFKKITKLTMRAISMCVASIEGQDFKVTEQNHILEYLENCHKTNFNLIRDHISELKKINDFDLLDITCMQCSHQYKQEFVLDISNFFETNS